MYRTLFYIPHEFAGISLFGVGWLLGLVVAYAAVTIALARRSDNAQTEIGSVLSTCAVGVVLIVFVFPMVEIKDMAGNPIGMAVRGYGVMMLMGVCGAVLLAVYRGAKRGISSDTIVAAAPWLCILGILGARTFYVIEYRDQFAGESVLTMMRAIVDFTRGGIVVYGSLIGGFIGLVIFCRRNDLSFFKMADIIIPCIFIGLFFGRIGCVLNGCCYGGRCPPSASAMLFPKGSPVYEDQLRNGDLLGLDVNWKADNRGTTDDGEITAVRKDSLAAQADIQTGQSVRIFLQLPPQSELDASMAADDTSQLGVTAVVDGVHHKWGAGQLPPKSLPVAPAQLYSSSAAIVVALVLIFITPLVRREGMLLGMGFATYAIVRFGLEAIRSDEPGQFGTMLTISQWVSILVFVASVCLMVYLQRASVPEVAAEVSPSSN